MAYKVNAARATAAKRAPKEAALAAAPLDEVMEVDLPELELDVDEAVLEAAAVARVALVPRTELLPPLVEVATAKPEETVPESPEPDPEEPDPEDPEVPVAELEAEEEEPVLLVTLEQLRS